MDAVEAIVIVILILAILVLMYYYLQNNPESLQRIRNSVPVNSDAYMKNIIKDNDDFSQSEELETIEKDDGVSKKIKVKLSDIDMSSFNTDAFSKKIDSFLDQKSDELIKEWSLATIDDLDALEDRFSKTTQSVDDLEKKFKSFKNDSKKFREETESRLDDIDERIKALEDK